MVVDNQALIELVDLIGGVEFDVPYVPGGMVYDDPTQNLHINLEPGLQLIDGEKAEQLLRFRKNNSGSSYPASYGSDDIGRMKTQRNFMIATAKQTLNLKNIFKIRDIIDIVYEYVDTNLSISTIKAYIPYAIDFNIENIRSASLPGTSVGPPEVPLWFIQVNKKEAAELMEELYGDGEEETENSGEGCFPDGKKFAAEFRRSPDEGSGLGAVRSPLLVHGEEGRGACGGVDDPPGTSEGHLGGRKGKTEFLHGSAVVDHRIRNRV